MAENLADLKLWDDDSEFPNGAPDFHGFVIGPMRDESQQRRHDSAVAEAAPFEIKGGWQDKEKVCLWKAFGEIGVSQIPYVHQTTGSCVGAGGSNAAHTLMANEIAHRVGDAEEFHLIWWLYTYGKSRELGGMRNRGDGSFGSTWVQAAKRYGFFRADVEGLPAYTTRNGWLRLPSSVEYKWSDGDAIATRWIKLGQEQSIQSYAEIKDSDDAVAALSNRYPITIASNFGTRTIRVKGSGEDKVRIASYDGSWAHQMSIDGYWRHPTEGLLFRIQNSWGPDAHPAPADDSPYGGFWIKESTFNKIARQRYSEIFAISNVDGFPSRFLLW